MESEEEYELCFLPSIDTSPHPLHSPQHRKPLRIHVSGPLSAIEKLLPHVPWNVDIRNQQELQPAAKELGQLIYRLLYKKELDSPNDAVPRLERLGWLNPNMPPDDVIYHGPNKHIDHYEVTFDHWVPFDEEDPEVLIIIICETEYEEAGHANRLYRGSVDPKDYAPYHKRLPAILRCCCTINRGERDRRHVNEDVKEREEWRRNKTHIFAPQ